MTRIQSVVAAILMLAAFSCESRIEVEVYPLGDDFYEIRASPGCSSAYKETVDAINPAASKVCEGDYRYTTIYGQNDGCGEFDGVNMAVECLKEESDATPGR